MGVFGMGEYCFPVPLAEGESAAAFAWAVKWNELTPSSSRVKPGMTIWEIIPIVSPKGENQSALKPNPPWQTR